MPRVTITVPEKNAQPYRFQLDREVVSLGRGSENDIAIESGSVSVHHAEMRRIEGGYELHDVGSTNGIKLDDIRYEIIPLRNGATVKIGDVTFDFTLSDEEIETLTLEKKPELPPINRLPEVIPLPRAIPGSYARPSSGGGLASTIVVLILATLAFFTGMAVHFQKDTGASLIEAIKQKMIANSAPVVPGPPAAK